MEDYIVSDFEIQALVDNELDWEAEKRVRSFLNGNAEAQKRYDELKSQKKMLFTWWQGQKRH